MSTIEIPRPHVPYGPGHVSTNIADADYLDEAARHIDGGYAVGGSNLTATVVKLLHDAATALRALDAPLIECPHWEPGKITMRSGCTACAADTLATAGSQSQVVEPADGEL